MAVAAREVDVCPSVNRLAAAVAVVQVRVTVVDQRRRARREARDGPYRMDRAEAAAVPAVDLAHPAPAVVAPRAMKVGRPTWPAATESRPARPPNRVRLPHRVRLPNVAERPTEEWE